MDRGGSLNVLWEWLSWIFQGVAGLGGLPCWPRGGVTNGLILIRGGDDTRVEKSKHGHSFKVMVR